MEEEQIVGVLYDAEGAIGRMSLTKMYDLVFTNRRIVGISTVRMGGARIAGQVLGGVLGQALAASMAKGGTSKGRQKYTGRPLDEIVAQDDANFSAPYSAIENAEVKGLISKRLTMRVNGKAAAFQLPSEQVPHAERLVATQIHK